MKNKDYIIQRRQAHHQALVKLAINPDKADGLKLWRKLVKLEREVHDATTTQCNGAAYGTQPFRPDWLPDGSEGTEDNPTPWEAYTDSVYDRIKAIFGVIPDGFMINHDARGCALKLDPDKCTIPDGMQTDWGGYAMLAAEIND